MACLATALGACVVAGCGAAPRTVERSTAPKAAAAARHGRVPGSDWRQFDFNAQRTGVGPAKTGITRRNLGQLTRRRVTVDGTVDSSPVELHGVKVGGRTRDVVFVTTAYGRTVAFDPGSGRKLWEFSPPSADALQGSAQITQSTPIIDPGRRYLYVASPDGYIHKLRVSDGRQIWATSVTRLPRYEKLAGALNIEGTSLIVTTDGYDGDAPPYQGHVLMLSLASGRITHEFNTLCSDRRGIIQPSSCPASDSAIFGRSGSVVEPGTGRILVATGNGPFNGSTNWGDSVLELSPTLKLLHNYTPIDQAALSRNDVDLGSTEPALLPKVGGLRLAVQGGKDGILRLLDLARLDGTTGPAGPRTGGELQEIADPGNTDLFTEPAVWTHRGHIYVFVADFNGTAAYELNRNRRLFTAWSNQTPGTSPLIAGGLLYVYDPNGSLLIRDPVSGRLLKALAAAPGHWNSPIVVGGRIIVPEGDYHDGADTGTIDIFHLPGR